MDTPKIEQAVRMILEAVGEDPDREGLRDTPARVARMYGEILSGMAQDPAAHLRAVFDEKHHEIVLVKDIPFESTCEHHMMPFHGKAHVAYIPQGKIVGISKVARIVETFARRLQVQERLTGQVADYLSKGLGASGVAVVMEASHTCMTMRGIRKPGSAMVTSAVRGSFASSTRTRFEFMNILNR